MSNNSQKKLEELRDASRKSFGHMADAFIAIAQICSEAEKNGCTLETMDNLCEAVSECNLSMKMLRVVLRNMDKGINPNQIMKEMEYVFHDIENAEGRIKKEIMNWEEES